MASNGLPNFAGFGVYTDSANTGGRLNKWLSRFTNMMVTMDVQSRAHQKALLLHYAGEQVHEIFETLSDTGASDDICNYIETLRRRHADWGSRGHERAMMGDELIMI